MTDPTPPTLTDEQLAEIERLARAAKQPCRTKPCTDYDDCAACDAVSPFADAIVSEEGAATILALVDRVRRAERERDEAEARGVARERDAVVALVKLAIAANAMPNTRHSARKALKELLADIERGEHVDAARKGST